MKFNLFKLNRENQTFINSVLNRGIGRSRLTSIALAKALSLTYALSPSEVNFDEYFYITFRTNALIILNDINETFLINIDEVLHYLLKFLKVRYQALCGDKSLNSDVPFILTPQNALLDLLGITQVFTPEESKLIHDEFFKLTELVNGFIPLIKEINDSEDSGE